MNLYQIYYVAATQERGVAVAHGPNWHKAWQVVVTTLYMNNPQQIPVLLLKVCRVVGEMLHTEFQTTYRTDDEQELAIEAHTSADGGPRHGS